MKRVHDGMDLSALGMDGAGTWDGSQAEAGTGEHYSTYCLNIFLACWVTWHGS